MAPSGDRISALPDNVLERVLSHLASDEAVRSSALSRRWRRVHEAVPVVNLVDNKSGDRYDRSLSDLKVCFDHQVTSAIMSKGAATPIRTFHVTVLHPPSELLDQWIVTTVNSGVEDLDVKLRYYDGSMSTLCPSIRCPYSGRRNSADFDKDERNRYTKTLPHIFRCHTLRRLCLTNWTLDLPGTVAMASLETLWLGRIMDPRDKLQQLISSCPCLVNLTLEECPTITEIAVTSARLRTFTMICCHNAKSVDLHSACVQSLRYKGGLPPRRSSSFITVTNPASVKALRIEICEKLSHKGPRDVDPVTRLISQCTKLAYLHLSLRPSMAYYSSMFTSVLRDLDSLTHLSLEGCLPTDHAVRSVSALLVNTKNLQVLSLFPLGPEPPKKKMMRGFNGHDNSESDSDTEPEDSTVDDGVEYSNNRMPQSLWRTYARCLEYNLRRINIENYQGRPLEKMVARFLLSRAAALEEFSATLAAGLHKDETAKELISWRWNRRTRHVMDPRGELQQLISSCPCLVNLTLAECPTITEIAVTSARLRTFTMICSHNATSVELHSACVQSLLLRYLRYKGGIPPRGSSSFITVTNPAAVKAVSIEICEKLSRKGPRDVDPVTRLAKLAYLHLSLRPSMAYYRSMFTSVLHGLDSLTHLSLEGCLPTDHAVRSVSALLVNTKNLHVLSLFPLGPEPPKKKMKMTRFNGQNNSESDSDTEPEDSGTMDDGVEYSNNRMSLWRTYARCLEYNLRRINIENYQGRPLDKMLARFLLSRAAALEEFSATLAAGLHKDETAKELISWPCP
ncbi:hypothetical protein ACQ4PT_030165 [Festuca glaucescens]